MLPRAGPAVSRAVTQHAGFLLDVDDPGIAREISVLAQRQPQAAIDQRIAVGGFQLAADRDRRPVGHVRIEFGLSYSTGSARLQVERPLDRPPIRRDLREPALNALDRVEIVEALQIALLDIGERLPGALKICAPGLLGFCAKLASDTNETPRTRADQNAEKTARRMVT
jgi:hypothetical protein